MPDNQHNDPLERFFRKKAGEYNIQYKEEDWLKLENRLDNVDNQRANRTRRHLAAAAVIFLFSVLAYITYDQQQKINQLNERLSDAENIVNLPNTVQGILPEEPSQEDEEKDNPQESPQDDIPGSINSSETPVLASDELSDLPLDISEEKESEEAFTAQQNENIQIADFTENYLAATSAKISPGVDGRSPAISAIKPPKFNASISLSENPRENSSAALESSPGLPQSSRFSVGVLLGPDMSTVGGISDFYNPGHKIGMMVEYDITPNLAVSVGAIHSKVRYEASGNEYRAPQEYWSYGISPDHTIGECILIDIPISLKYDFLHFHKSRIYATAGASSYIMLDEDYRFNYENNNSGLQQRWHEKTGTRHWMSNATLSVGYELDLSQTLSIRAEPFLKIPIQEVGWGNVKLYSMGSFISLNYNFH